MQVLSFISKATSLPNVAVENTLKLLQEGCTVPFISRYRKEAIGNIDEVAVESIKKSWESYQALEKRKETVFKALEEQ